MFSFTLYTADWCKPCQAMKPIIKEFAEKHSGVVELAILDVETCAKPLPAYIKSVPTLAVTRNGELLNVVHGFQTVEMLEGLLEGE